MQTFSGPVNTITMHPGGAGLCEIYYIPPNTYGKNTYFYFKQDGIEGGSVVTIDGKEVSFAEFSVWFAKTFDPYATVTTDPMHYGAAARIDFLTATPLPEHGVADFRQEVIDKITLLAQKKYSEDYDKLFAAYDADGDGRLSLNEVVAMFADAGVGYLIDRRMIARLAIAFFDPSGTGSVARADYRRVLGL